MLKIKLKPNIVLTKNIRFKEQNEKLQYVQINKTTPGKHRRINLG